MSGPPKLERRPDWEPALNAFIEGVFDKPHKYGSHDCIMYGLNAVKAQTGKDLARGHRRKYSTELGAAKYLRGLGFETAEAAIDSILPSKPVGFAQRGDLVLCPGDAIGVCFGGYALVVGQIAGEETEGLRRVPREHWSKAWGV